jgi:hypothetical protein
MCFSLGFSPFDFVGMQTTIHEWTFTWTGEDASFLQRGLHRLDALPGLKFGEKRVNIEPWTIPGQFGTMDRAIITDDVILVSDLKYGRWPVYPRENLQLILYALGLWNDIARHHTKATKFILEIDQPRCAGGGGVWETDLDELLRAGAWLKQRAELTQQPNPQRTASEKGCVFCRRRIAPGGCNTYARFNAALLGQEPEEMDFNIMVDNPLVPQGVITPERRAYILSHRKMLETWFDQLAEQELADYLAGMPTPGRKAVDDTQKGKRAAWIDETGAAAALTPIIGAEKTFTKKLITPVQAGKLVTPEDYKKIAPFIRPGEAGKSMVPLEDARQAISVIDADDFDDLID